MFQEECDAAKKGGLKQKEYEEPNGAGARCNNVQRLTSAEPTRSFALQSLIAVEVLTNAIDELVTKVWEHGNRPPLFGISDRLHNPLQRLDIPSWRRLLNLHADGVHRAKFRW